MGDTNRTWQEAIEQMGMLQYGTYAMQQWGQKRPEAERDWLTHHGYYALSDEQAMTQLQLHLYQAYAVAHGGNSWDAMRRYKAFHAKEGTNQ